MAKRNNAVEKINANNSKRKKIDETISKLESLSNELFMELFEYFDLYSLYLTFFSLNSRFDSVLRHCRVHVNLDRMDPSDFTSFIGRFLSSHMDNGRILSLRSSLPHQVAVVANDLVMERFAHIRALSLTHASIDVVTQVLDRVEKSTLESVSITFCKRMIGTHLSLTEHLLSAELYPALRSLRLLACNREIASLANLTTKTPMNQLKNLVLGNGASAEHLFNVFQLSPNLRQFDIALHDCDKLNLLIPLPILPTFSSMLHLKLTYSIIRDTTLEYLLNSVPHLLTLHLDFTTHSSKLADPELWMEFFGRMRRLRQTHIKMDIKSSETNLTVDQVRDRARCFPRLWYFNCHLINRMNTMRINIDKRK